MIDELECRLKRLEWIIKWNVQHGDGFHLPPDETEEEFDARMRKYRHSLVDETVPFTVRDMRPLQEAEFKGVYGETLTDADSRS